LNFQSATESMWNAGGGRREVPTQTTIRKNRKIRPNIKENDNMEHSKKWRLAAQRCRPLELNLQSCTRRKRKRVTNSSRQETCSWEKKKTQKESPEGHESETPGNLQRFISGTVRERVALFGRSEGGLERLCRGETTSPSKSERGGRGEVKTAFGRTLGKK